MEWIKGGCRYSADIVELSATILSMLFQWVCLQGFRLGVHTKGPGIGFGL